MITPQIVAEFWNVATRPREQNGIGLTPDLAATELAQIEGSFTIVGESTDVYYEWKRIVALRGVSGVRVHDTRLVAAMKVYGIDRILTFNAGDFARYSDIKVVHPADIVASSEGEPILK